MTVPASPPSAAPARGIALILVGVLCITINDVSVKFLSGGYPLHQIVFLRSLIGICIALAILMAEGGPRLLWTRRPVLHGVRVLLLVSANLFFFTGLAVLTLAQTTALFFIAPLLITLMSAVFLGEKMGARRIGAVVVGFVGVLVMLGPSLAGAGPPLGASLLPLASAVCYAAMQTLTRKLRAESSGSAMAVYIQVGFLGIGALAFLTIGDGRFAAGLENPSLIFALRAWVWPAAGDLWVFALIGGMAGIVSYALSQAYRLADAATIAPFEYAALPFAVILGFLVFGEMPDATTGLGIALIAGAGIYVFLRERRRGVAAVKLVRRA